MSIEVKRSPEYVSMVLRERGIKWKPDTKRRRLSGISNEVFGKIYLECGRNVVKMGKRLGVVAKTVSAEMKLRGMKPPMGAPPKFLWTKELLNRLYHECGLSLEAIAGVVGVHEFTVHKWMKRFGIQRRVAKIVGGKVTPSPAFKSGTLPPEARLTPEQIMYVESNRIYERLRARRVEAGETNEFHAVDGVSIPQFGTVRQRR